ncbi:hypothetical protein A0H81_11058 [Grifola frondosa]|uniref:F-box domain-containing protein n=1 Tax=Grifola frondosa TaxID=5627 RepID=A0A1C7LW15_GRIFR|nr:hypothetical protein A0H81_11058 [Grifola frondosa]
MDNEDIDHNGRSELLDSFFSPYTDDDEQNSKDFTYIVAMDDTDSYVHRNWNATIEELMSMAREHVRAVPDLSPEHCWERPQKYISSSTGKEYEVDPEHDSPCMLVNTSALRILTLAAPRLTIQRLWVLDHLMRDQYKYASEIRYGFSWGSFWQEFQLHSEGDDPALDEMVRKVVMRGKAEEADIKEMMFGKGHMYVLMNPDVFPVKEAYALGRRAGLAQLSQSLPENISKDVSSGKHTLSGLPFDILLLICHQLPLPSLLIFCTLCRSLLRALVLHLDSAVHASMKLYEPWHIPPPTGIFPKGHNQKWFDEEHVAASASSGGDSAQPFPWLGYARACRTSASMKNRRRLWDVARQLEKLADERGVPEE